MSLNSAGTIVTLILGLGTLTALAAGTYVLFRASLSSARINALREDNTDLRNRVDDQDKALIKCGARESALEIQVEHLKQENILLHDLVTSKADVETLKKEVTKLFAKLEAHHQQVYPVMVQIRDALNND